MSEPVSSEQRPATASLADEEGVKRILVDTAFGLWGKVNNLNGLRPSKRKRYRVTIFGSARAQPGTWVYDEVRRLAGDLAAMGCDIGTGGGPGLMRAAKRRRAGTRGGRAGQRVRP